MSMNVSRQPFITGLSPDQWVVVMQDQEGVASPAGRTVRDYYHNIGIVVEADSANTANAEFLVQDSDDGITWVQRYRHPTPLVPGGQLAFGSLHVRAKFRVLAFSHGRGFIKTYLAQPEEQASPDYLTGVHLACASMCEQECETGLET